MTEQECKDFFEKVKYRKIVPSDSSWESYFYIPVSRYSVDIMSGNLYCVDDKGDIETVQATRLQIVQGFKDWKFYEKPTASCDCPSLDEDDCKRIKQPVYPGFKKLECECGALKAYGKDCPSNAHSSWCPLYKE
jgi:hypothetical protein